MQSNLLELISIDRRSTVEYDSQLKESIKSLILDKTFYYHTVLPSPKELSEFLGIKEKLVIKAYQQLENERYIHLDSDNNFIVSFFELTNHFFDRNTTVHEAIISLGLEPSIECLEKKVVRLEENVIKNMGFDENKSHEYLYINRIYFGDLQPIMILENYLPLYIFPDLNERFNGNEPLDKFLKETYGIGNSSSKRIIKSVNLDERLAKHLNEAKNAPSIQSTNQVFDKFNRLIDYGRSHTVSSYYFQALITRQEMEKYLNS
ncbi:GntR family transcriptional regulator [Candidatus Izemoplasma sp. B36]|uniref:GntR family transcriptional regulator n=1 Tax=Candidatus Izemoplasma sp. B36 TaxID=3242468 RepID=UPI003558F4BE